VAAARVRAVYLAFEDPVAALPVLAETAELARAHGYVEQAGWCDSSRCEVLFVLGRWDEALAVGTGVVDVAERNAYQRLAFRTYVVLLAIGAVRRDPSIANRYRSWTRLWTDHLPAAPSPYAKVMTAAVDAWMSSADGRDPDAPPEATVDAIIPMINPHFVAAVETLARAWLDRGRRDLAEAAGDRVAGFLAEDDATPLMRASSALIDAWLGRVEPAAAVEAARAAGAPWWVARALRAAGSAEAEQLERSLRIRG
jgi:hypothetical protein